MKTVVLSTIAAGLMFTASISQAEIVTWKYQGTLTSVDGAANHQVGDTFEALVRFDIDANLISTARNRFSFDPTALKIDYRIGNDSWQYLSYNPGFGGLIFLRNDQTSPNPEPAPHLVDGISYSLNNNDSGGGATLILRWNDLSAINGNNLFRTPPALNNLEDNGFNAGDGSTVFYGGTITSVTAVPEPETYAMMLAGLAGLGFMARRKKAIS